ncbi:MAG: hypothetical protein FD143_446 [Ignavibacteria bacterium]|nr:MAG: hypothetical protein FD143_446 [Ignavibacteria bacterium]KAF0161517.1 MAG: hypothetical protein FD188_634 [Ignavibacteria bacterium]
MKKNIDELLNDYIDNQLSPEEIDEVKLLLDSTNKTGEELKALRAVHNSLHKLHNDPAPAGFTERFMKKLGAVQTVSRNNLYFFYGVVGFFAVLIVGILAFIIYSINWNFESMNLSFYVEQVKAGIEKNGGKALSIFKNKTVLMISSSLVLLLLILAYFRFESHKNWKKKFNSCSY